MLKFEPSKHTLHYFKNLLGSQRILHKLYNFGVSEYCGLIQKMDDGLHFL
jgi:hypothetical protein